MTENLLLIVASEILNDPAEYVVLVPAEKCALTSAALGPVYVNTFSGTASSAQYADLAERYLADADYEVGTVLVFGGSAEVTATSKQNCPSIAGVVSENPAYLMNSELEGDHVTSVALKGRVPVKVVGRIKKGDVLIHSTTEGLPSGT